MCGLAGLGIGCAVAPTCPKSLLLRGKAKTGPTPATFSPLDSWDERASVRTRPHPTVDPTDDLGFPAEYVPVASHALIDPVHRPKLLGRHLHRYLLFTAKLEHFVVNRTVLGLAHDSTGLEVPDWMRRDAYKIYVDEGYHAFIAADLADQVADRHGLTREIRRGEPYFMTRLAETLRGVGPELAPIVEMLFVICSETLISGTLSDAAESEGLSAPVRQALTDHAHDERRHHAYFAEFLRVLWPQLNPATQRSAGKLVPGLIDTFLRPDFADMTTELTTLGLSADDAERVVAESLPEAVIARDRREFARHTVRYFAQVGALDHPEVEAAFDEADLLDGLTE